MIFCLISAPFQDRGRRLPDAHSCSVSLRLVVSVPRLLYHWLPQRRPRKGVPRFPVTI